MNFGGSANLTWDGTTLNSTALRGQNILIANDIIKNALANRNVTLQGGDGTGKVVVTSDFEVHGRAIGTAPYVTGMVWVTMDGSDSNDGLTEDRAKKTISAAAATAANMIRFQGWTYATIKVRAGEYLEPNPITVRSGITIVGDNLRGVTVIPKNPYADILWLNPKTYVTGITFRGHRFPAAVAQFPADGVGLISDVHDWASPYVQNCSSITLGAYDPNDPSKILYQAGTGMIVDGKRGRKLSQSSQSNINVATASSTLDDNKILIYQDLYPTLGSEVFGSSTSDTPWILQSGIAGSATDLSAIGTPCNVVAVTSTTLNGVGAWQIEIESNTIGTVTINDTKWGNVSTDSSVLVLDSTYPDLDKAIGGNWVLLDEGLTSAVNLLELNKEFIKAEVNQYVQTNFPGFLNMTQLELCTRDVGTIVECLIADIWSGTREGSVAAGSAYWRGNQSLIAGQFYETTTAIDYIKDLAIQVINNQQVTPTYQTAVTQTINLNITGGGVAATPILTGVEVINNIIVNGPELDMFGNSAELLRNNKAFMQAEVLAFVNSTFPDFQYDQTRCYRDVGYIVDGVIYDILNGRHLGSVRCGIAYFNGNASLITNQEAQTVEAIEYAKFLALNIVNNLQIRLPFQTTVQQYLNAELIGGNATNAIIIDAFDIITSIILNGPSVRPYRENPNSTTVGSGFENAYLLMQLNRKFIQKEVVCFVRYTYPEFQYDESKCERDAGLIVDAVSWDMYWGGRGRSTAAGRAYWNGTYLSIRGEITQTLAALEHAKSIAISIIQKNAVTPIYQTLAPFVPAQPVITQTIPLGYQYGSIATTRCSSAFDLIMDIIEYGPQATAPVPALNDAAKLLELNKSFLSAQVVSWVQNVYGPPSGAWSTKCGRDVGYIVDCMANDIVTGRDSESRSAGTAYWDGVTSRLPPDQAAPTVAAINYLRDISLLIINNQTVTVQPGVLVPQYKNPTLYPNGLMAAGMMQANYDLIANIVANGLDAAEITVDAQNAAAVLRANRNFIQAETIAYININYPAFQYDGTTCARDVGYIVDGVCADLLAGGYASGLACGRAYWDGVTSQIPGEITETVAALGHTKNIAVQIAQNITVSALQSLVTQDTSLPPAVDAVTVNQITDDFTLITNVLQNGANTGTLLSKGFIDAYNLLMENSDFLAAMTVAWVEYNYNTPTPTLDYDQAKCLRDAGLLVAAVATDLITGMDLESVAAGNAYWRGVTSVLPGDQLTPTVGAITYLRGIALQAINQTTIDRSAVNYTGPLYQTPLNPALDGSIGIDSVTDSFDVIIDLVQNGPSITPIYIIGTNSVTSILPAELDGQPAWQINFTDPLGGYYFGPFRFQGVNGPLVLVPPGSIRPYQGQGLSSFVLDAFTQYNEISYVPDPPQGTFTDLNALNQGGMGIVIKNGGYAQLVSIFEICCNIGVLCQSGGTCSITNSNTDFGNYGLWADGVSEMQYNASMAESIDYGGINEQFRITGLPKYDLPPPGDAYKRPYVGQVVTISKYLADFDVTAQQFYVISRMEITDPGSRYVAGEIPNITIQNPSIYSGGFEAQAQPVMVPDDDNPGFWKVGGIDLVVSGSMFIYSQLTNTNPTTGFVVIDPPADPTGIRATATAIGDQLYWTIVAASEPDMGECVLILDEKLPFEPDVGENPSNVEFFQVSRIISSSHCFEYIGSGTDIGRCIPARGGVPIQENEVVMTRGGRVAYTSTDHLGNFRIGEELVINQNTGTLSGRTFQKSLFAIMTPYMLAIEGS